MKRLILPILLAAGLLAPVATPASAAAAPKAPKGAKGPKLSVSAKLTACASSLEQSGRFMVAEGRMRRVAGASRLGMRFDLEVRTPEQKRWTAVDGPQFGVWTNADPAPRRYLYSKRVENLTAPATYRMIVRYRWVDRKGRVIARSRRTTRACEQLDLRPDLEPERVRFGPVGEDGRRSYVVEVTNAGRTAAAPFSVSIGVAGETRTVAVPGGLAAGAATELELVGPACEDGVAVASVDPAGAVDEADETDNLLPQRCR